MKKAIAILLSLTMILGLTACVQIPAHLTTHSAKS